MSDGFHDGNISFYYALANGDMQEAYFHLGTMDTVIGTDSTYLVPPEFRDSYQGGHLVTILTEGWA